MRLHLFHDLHHLIQVKGLLTQNIGFYEVPELADIAWPLILFSIKWQLRTECFGPSVLLDIFLPKMPGQQGDVRSPLPKWGNLQLNPFDSVVEVRPKSSLLYKAEQIPVCSKNQPDVNIPILCFTDAADFLVFQSSQEFDLCLIWHVPDFVQKQSSSGSGFQQTFSFPLCPSKGSLSVSEQL